MDVYYLERSIANKGDSYVSKYVKKALKSGKGAIKITKQAASDRVDVYKLMGVYYWLVNKQKKAYKWWDKSIKEGDRIGARLELSRTYFEVGKRLFEPKSKHQKLNGITAEEYLEKARVLFEEMDLQWDLEQLEKVKRGEQVPIV